MAAITNENRDAWQALADEVSKKRPSVGKKVKIVKGRKHKGKEGIVVRHMRDQYDFSSRYWSDAQATLREMTGRDGYVIEVKQDDGSKFWVKADYTEILA